MINHVGIISFRDGVRFAGRVTSRDWSVHGLLSRPGVFSARHIQTYLHGYVHSVIPNVVNGTMFSFGLV